MIKAKNKNSLLQALPLKQYEPKPYDEEAAKKYAESLEKLLPLLDEMKKMVEAMQAKGKELEGPAGAGRGTANTMTPPLFFIYKENVQTPQGFLACRRQSPRGD